jgi:hypothetical protein
LAIYKPIDADATAYSYIIIRRKKRKEIVRMNAGGGMRPTVIDGNKVISISRKEKDVMEKRKSVALKLWSSEPYLLINVTLVQRKRLLEHASKLANLAFKCGAVWPRERRIE